MMDSVEIILRLDFAIRQLNSTLDQVTSWMAGREPSLAAFSFEERAKLAVNFFADTDKPAHILLGGDYLNLIVAARKLTQDQADFIAGQCQGDTASMRDEARTTLNRLADILDGLNYPGKDAERLHKLADET
jgi:hypothetical protein